MNDAMEARFKRCLSWLCNDNVDIGFVLVMQKTIRISFHIKNGIEMSSVLSLMANIENSYNVAVIYSSYYHDFGNGQQPSIRIDVDFPRNKLNFVNEVYEEINKENNNG